MIKKLLISALAIVILSAFTFPKIVLIPINGEYDGMYKDNVIYVVKRNLHLIEHEMGHHRFPNALVLCKDSVTQYGEKNVFEGVAEEYVFYKYAGETFREMASKNKCLELKYEEMKNRLGKEYGGRAIACGYTASTCTFIKTNNNIK